MKRLGAAIGLFILAVSFFLFYPFYNVLQISNVRNGTVLFCARMVQNEEFILSFIHSVNRRPVFDTVRIKGNHLLIIKSRFDSLGAGMPEASSNGNPLKLGKDGWLECMVNLSVKELTFFLGFVANHTLSLKGQNIKLSNLAEPGTLLSLSVRKASRLDLRKGRCME